MEVDALSFGGNDNRNLMGSLTDPDQVLREYLDNLISCLNLNEFSSAVNLTLSKRRVNASIVDEAWSYFLRLRDHFSFENQEMIWLCSIVYLLYEKLFYINMKQLLSLSDEERLQELFRFSLIKMQKFSHTSIQAFIKNTNRLAEIISMPKELCARLNRLESNFNVSSVLFLKYNLIFKDIFDSSDPISVTHSNKTEMLSSSNSLIGLVHKFGWLLFIYTKNQFPYLCNDLVNSYHLLICSINTFYLNMKTLLAQDLNDEQFLLLRKSLLLKQVMFEVSSENHENQLFNTKNYMLDYFCRNFDGNLLQVKTINEHHFKPHVRSLAQAVSKSFLPNSSTSDEYVNLFEQIADFKQVYIEVDMLYDRSLDTKQFTDDFNYSLVLDERLFITNELSINVDANTSNFESIISQNEEESTLRYELKLPRCLNDLIIGKVKNDQSKPQQVAVEDNLDCIDFTINSFLKNDNLYASELNFDSVDLLQNIITTISAKIRDITKSNLNSSEEMEKNITDKLIDRFLRYVIQFYLHTIQYMLCHEKKRFSENKSSDSDFKLHLSKTLQSNKFHKSVYLCCLEIMLNFCTVHKSSVSIKFIDFAHFKSTSAYKNISFPGSLTAISLNSADFFRVIELFIKANTATSDHSVYLNREMIKHMNKVEENILESLAWQSDSAMWTELSNVRINPSYTENTLFSYTAPLNDELYTHLSNNSMKSVTNNYNSNTGGGLLGAVVFSSNDLSPAKHPTITRVVCSNNSTQVQSLNETKNPTKPTRLLNLNTFLVVFYRKFYSLAMQRTHQLVDKLNLADRLIEHSRLANNQKESSGGNANSASTTMLQLTPNPILTPIATVNPTQSTPSNSTPSNLAVNSNAYLFNENRQILFRKIWNIFEYSVCVENGAGLIKQRHMDQLIMCAVYLTCRLNSLNIQFKEIIKAYKLMQWTNGSNRAQIYRQVLVKHDCPETVDIIRFYNEIYLCKLKNFACQLMSSAAVTTNNMRVSSSVSQTYYQFTPRCISSCDGQPVFVTPSQGQHSLQILRPSMLNRNKSVFTLRQTNAIKSVELINEMIKKNEVKIKTTNKRLFTEISSHNLIPPGMANSASNSIITNAINNVVPNVKENSSDQRSFSGRLINAQSAEEENQGKGKKIARINSFNSFNRPMISSIMSSNNSAWNDNAISFLSRAVTATNPVDGALKTGNSNSSMITTVVNSAAMAASSLGSGSTVHVGGNFAKRLQNLQYERS